MPNIAPYISFNVSAEVNSINIIESLDDLMVLGLSTRDDFVVLGEGSNTIFTGNYSGKVIINKIDCLEINKLDDVCFVTAGAGINWHHFVCQMSDSGFYGLENLAYIPGTVGASPVQNIGAYGVEVEKFIYEVVCYDLSLKKVIKKTHKECNFSYRDSEFKTEKWRARYVIIAVTFILPLHFEPNISYKDLHQEFDRVEFSAKNLLDKVIEVRKEKLPNHLEIPNAGSYFKNPIIKIDKYNELLLKYPDIPSFDVQGNNKKIPAAWLIQESGFKGVSRDNGAGVYEKHSLILVNNGGAKGSDIYTLACDIIDEIKNRFGIELEPEIRYIGEQNAI